MIPPTASLWLVAVLAHALLKFQLFDVDIRIKTAVRRSLVVGAFGFTFLVVKETVEALAAVEGTLAGILASVAISLAFRQVRALARRIANFLLPGVRETEGYVLARKREAYQAALGAAWRDGRLGPRERAFLRRLRESLDLPAAELDDLEARPGAAR